MNQRFRSRIRIDERVHAPARRAPLWRVLLAFMLAWSASIGTVNAATSWPGGRWELTPAQYDMTATVDVPVLMSDGVTIMTHVTYPATLGTKNRAPGTFPVLLTQNPYVIGAPPEPLYVTHGYIFVAADVRGSGLSGGNFGYFSPRDAQDGAELVAWIRNRLDGSNGAIGLTGCSYLGVTQVFTAAAVGRDSGVKAIIPACGGGGRAYDQSLPGGVPGSNVQIALTVGGALIGPRALAFFTDWYTNIKSDGPYAFINNQFWGLQDHDAMARKIVDNGIAVLNWTGWNDAYAGGKFDFYAALQNAARQRQNVFAPFRDSTASGKYQLIIGPWGHAEGLDPGIMLAWYDTFVRGQRTDIDKTTTPLHLFELGSDRWVNLTRYPMVEQYTRFKLQAGGLLTQSGIPVGADPLLWIESVLPGGSLEYTTPAFVQGATLAGPIGAQIYASSTTSNLQLIADLLDVAPDGATTRLTSGALLGSFHPLDQSRTWYDTNGFLIKATHSFTADDLVPAGTVKRYDFTIDPRLAAIKPGHRLRLKLIAKSACDVGFSASPPPCDHTLRQTLQLTGGVFTILHDTIHPSAINLPLLPYRVFPETTSGVTPTSNGVVEPLAW